MPPHHLVRCLCVAALLLAGCRNNEQVSSPVRAAFDPVALGERLDAALPLNSASVAARVIDLSSGEELYAREADRPMMPASNLKTLTTATALDLLGADHVFETKLAAQGDDLYLIGSGDPALGDPTIAGWQNQKPTDHFEPFFKALRAKGINNIKGNLYYDDSAFDDQRIHPSWSKSFRQFWYAAPVAGLNFNDNCIDVTIHPTQAGQPVRYEVMPPTSRIKIVNQCITSADKHVPDIRRADNDDYTYILGGPCKDKATLPSKPVQDPGHFTAAAFKTYLASKGIAIGGQIIRKPLTRETAKPGNPVLPPGGALLATHKSSMRDVLARTNKNSQNMFAEALSKLAGAAYAAQAGGTTLANADPASWPGGAQAIRAFLQKHKIDASALVAADGSGLSRENRVTPRIMTDLLVAMNRHPHGRLWIESLAQPRQPGTLRTRLTDLSGKIKAKTGTIGGVRALSGYLTTADNKTLVFSFLLNDIKDESTAAAHIDNAVRILAGIVPVALTPATTRSAGR